MVLSWGQDLIENCHNLRLGAVHVVNTISDIDDVPRCRVALVFVVPDEREMIIEDARHHIGSGLRRLTVQRLQTLDVEVFLVIFFDKKSEALSEGQLYNSRLSQINYHELLTQLKLQDRIVSINTTFAEWQRNHLLRRLNSIST